ncbi:MSHA biogenesis protein MshP [Enterovibrio norvegicus]|uniref:MSHA biogenesis protein MshP n=1 Tax=Enterovibrio norvegicus TaxID=188144 RepID=A0A2N7LCL3_9GAMM|nr:MSHA biogenesis protein MshP [Enterovibrio norvegicus]PMN93068.1 MSHA biogenesis protein MshP [Enterovibrio norvegicus]
MRRSISPFRRHQKGSMLIVSVFTITALAALGAALMQINWSQSDTTTREVLGTRAWFAANSGTEMAMTKLFPLQESVDDVRVADCAGITAEEPISFSVSGLKGCSVSVTCEVIGENELAQYHIESKGECGSGHLKVVRVQESWAKELTL